MNKAKYLFLLIAALAFDSCRPTARQTAAEAEQPTDSTEGVARNQNATYLLKNILKEQEI